LLAIAGLVLDGERLAKENDFSAATAKLQTAVRMEDSLQYDEPPDWIQPARHTLGAVLLRAGRAAEAESVYREDLRRNPENGWALMGLRDTLRQLGKPNEAAAVNKRCRKAWTTADVSPEMTCYCQTGMM
jgi:Flp pilus assembly protein TadD